jgi:hypothetical protein
MLFRRSHRTTTKRLFRQKKSTRAGGLLCWTDNKTAFITPALPTPRLGAGAQVAQLVEQATENRCVGGSIPPLGTIEINRLAK